MNVYYKDPKHGDVEIYGLTKESGATFLMLKYAIPGIAPREFNFTKSLQGQILRYDGAGGLLSLLNKILSGEIDLKEIKEKSLQNRKIFFDDVKACVDDFLRFVKNDLRNAKSYY